MKSEPLQILLETPPFSSGGVSDTPRVLEKPSPWGVQKDLASNHRIL